MEDTIQKNRDLAMETLREMGFHFPNVVRDLCCQDLINMIRSDLNSSNSMIYRFFAGISMEDSLFDFALKNLAESAIKGTFCKF